MHKNYTDYSEFIAELQKVKVIQATSLFIYALADIKKNFTLARLEEI